MPQNSSLEKEVRDLTQLREDVCQPIARALFGAFSKRDNLPLGEASAQEIIDYYNEMYVSDFLPLVINHPKFKWNYLDYVFELMHLIVDSLKERTEILLNQDYTKASAKAGIKLFAILAKYQEQLPFDPVKKNEETLKAYLPAAAEVEEAVKSIPELASVSPLQSFTMLHAALDDLKIRAAFTLNARMDTMTNLALGLVDKDDLTIKDINEKLTALYEAKTKKQTVDK